LRGRSAKLKQGLNKAKETPLGFPKAMKSPKKMAKKPKPKGK